MTTPREIVADWLRNVVDPETVDAGADDNAANLIAFLEAAGFVIIPRPE